MFYLKPVARKSGFPTALNTNRTATCRRLIFPIWNQEESYLENSEQGMRKLIYPLMFCSSHDAIHFLRIVFCFGWIRVAIGIILGIERLPA